MARIHPNIATQPSSDLQTPTDAPGLQNELNMAKELIRALLRIESLRKDLDLAQAKVSAQETEIQALHNQIDVDLRNDLNAAQATIAAKDDEIKALRAELEARPEPKKLPTLETLTLHTDDLHTLKELNQPHPFHDKGGDPMYIGLALNFEGGKSPCKIAPHLNKGLVRVPFHGKEVIHHGLYELVPFVSELMEFVPSVKGRVPEGRRPVEGGYEKNGNNLYHAIMRVDDIWVPGKAGEHLCGGMVAHGDKEHWFPDCKMLCWKD